MIQILGTISQTNLALNVFDLEHARIGRKMEGVTITPSGQDVLLGNFHPNFELPPFRGWFRHLFAGFDDTVVVTYLRCASDLAIRGIIRVYLLLLISINY